MDRFNGKKIVLFGHSMATANGGSAGVGIPETKTYGGLLRDLNNCVIYRNAVPNSKISSASTDAIRLTNPDRWNFLDTEISAPDIIIIDAGINDFHQSVPLGTIADTTIATFYGALDYLLKSMIPRYLNSRIFFKLPCHITYMMTSPEKNTAGVYLTEFVKAIEDVCYRYGVSTINSFQDSGQNFYNTPALTIEGIHHNESGARKEYEIIRSTLNYKLNNIFSDVPLPQTSVVFDIRSNNIGNLTYNEVTNELTEQVSASAFNYEFALTDDCQSAVITMPVESPIPFSVFCIGSDSQGNAFVIYANGTGNIYKFDKNGLTGSAVLICNLPTLRPNVPKGTAFTIAHGTDNITISYGSFTREIPYSLLPGLTTKSIGVLCTGADVNKYLFDKIN